MGTFCYVGQRPLNKRLATSHKIIGKDLLNQTKATLQGGDAVLFRNDVRLIGDSTVLSGDGVALSAVMYFRSATMQLFSVKG